ncbi:MAG: hypothetical protein O2960_05455 [Verrucomicrobia bacterium]|nr:hypothetical protein [Verrucomicrobiota bacterium]
MQTEFYRSQTDLIPTFSLVLAAASLVSLNSTGRTTINPVNGAPGIQPPTVHYSHAYYGQPGKTTDHAEQGAALQQFAESLLKKTEESPQAVVDLLNRHFWDLV